MCARCAGNLAHTLASWPAWARRAPFHAPVALEEANVMRTVLSIAVGMALALVAPAALAQDTPPPPAGDGTLPPPKVVTKTTVETGAAGAKKEEEDPTSDHEK